MTSQDDDDAEGEAGFWEQLDESPAETADWSGDELESAYLRALEVLDATEASLPEPPVAESAPDTIAELPAAPAATAQVDRVPETQLQTELNALAAGQLPGEPPPPPSGSVTPRQILEALLFVGGDPLPTKKLINVLRGEFSTEFIETELQALNELYLREQRPYEIRLMEGGYRMVLRDEFERIRRKAYGLGPKEVKLSQEAIEVLALIAYQQPLAATAIEELKPGSGGIVRQLLRRELVAMQRGEGQPRQVTYRTTPRFLSLFGIRNLNELPRLEQVIYK